MCILIIYYSNCDRAKVHALTLVLLFCDVLVNMQRNRPNIDYIHNRKEDGIMAFIRIMDPLNISPLLAGEF